ncbi:hypothetical protein Egran_06230 [Elaphomyces granulatus]|uniref:Uncharacterized protein n=1 Tax=Elaphomyces granulatus TaxID=519963 RepID=A0A232LPF0_9EURO|nr:hypothetical protein Egran_06230 [Elaphomyces granulatus]
MLHVHDASTKGAAVIASILADGGIPSAIWGVNAAVHYGGGLCPMDIELVINDADQERAFAVLISQGALPAVPEDSAESRPAEFTRWRELAPSYRFRDRRRVRLCTPMYELPGTGNPFDPFVILYSTEAVGLCPVPFPEPLEASSESPYVLVSSDPLVSPDSASQDSSGDKIILAPTFPSLVESEVHVLSCIADHLSPVWGQHMAQLSELLRSRSCDKGYDSLQELVNPRLSQFSGWIQSHLRGDNNVEPPPKVGLVPVDIMGSAAII